MCVVCRVCASVCASVCLAGTRTSFRFWKFSAGAKRRAFFRVSACSTLGRKKPMSDTSTKKKKNNNSGEEEEGATVGWEDLPVVIRVRIRLLAKRKAAADALAVALHLTTSFRVSLRQQQLRHLFQLMGKISAWSRALGFETLLPPRWTSSDVSQAIDRYYDRSMWRVNPFNEADGERLVLLSEYVDLDDGTLHRAACACSKDLADVHHTPFAVTLSDQTIERWASRFSGRGHGHSEYLHRCQWMSGTTLLSRKWAGSHLKSSC